MALDTCTALPVWTIPDHWIFGLEGFNGRSKRMLTIHFILEKSQPLNGQDHPAHKIFTT